MASTKSCIARMSRLSISPATIRRSQPSPFVCLPCQQLRHASDNAAKYKRKDTPKTQKKKKTRSTFKEPDLSNAEQFSLCDAMRLVHLYLNQASTLSLFAPMSTSAPSKSAAPHLRKIRNAHQAADPKKRPRGPQPPTTPPPRENRPTHLRHLPPDSAAADAARKAGASLVGEDNVFEAVKEGKVDFDRCICHVDSLQKLNKAGLGRILGPKGLMPSAKMGTVVKDVATTVRDMVGGAEYRERMGVVRMAIGQLGFSPEEMQRNIKAFVGEVRKDIAQLSDRIAKDVHEVVLSSTNAPGFSLNGDFRGPDSVPTKDLSTL
ncbi:hypothetical protein H2199_006277 [Coniosporium tulheliwenetii]|uniref:Uncharacterized protein n=1 Tax=Coniosporium tulheliwenetii TaxID=3383036 RepID=A0ACC2YXP7_9PEZI|nr:hypothetical protein H2199_006277 [Cladosporium sp. JES 115]